MTESTEWGSVGTSDLCLRRCRLKILFFENYLFLFIFKFFKIIFCLCHHAACRILVPQPGIEPMPHKVEMWILNHWTTRKVPKNTFSSAQFSHSVMSDSLRPHELQHARLPCPSPIPRVYSNSSPLSQWCHPTISSSVIPFSSCPQSFPASGSFQMSQLSTSGGQSIGVSASTSVLPMNTQDWFPLGWTGWIFLQSKGLSRVFSNTAVQKHQFFGAQLSL